jgi:hypothetical protein
VGLGVLLWPNCNHHLLHDIYKDRLRHIQDYRPCNIDPVVCSRSVTVQTTVLDCRMCFRKKALGRPRGQGPEGRQTQGQ